MKRFASLSLAVAAGLTLAFAPVSLAPGGLKPAAALAAAPTPQAAGPTPQTTPEPTNVPPASAQGTCGEGQVQLSVSILSSSGNCVSGDPAKGGVIVAYLIMILKLLGGLVGAVILLMLVIAGIQYITAVGDPAQIKKAKSRITNAITALILYAFMYAILNFLIPGGIFG